MKVVVVDDNFVGMILHKQEALFISRVFGRLTPIQLMSIANFKDHDLPTISELGSPCQTWIDSGRADLTHSIFRGMQEGACDVDSWKKR